MAKRIILYTGKGGVGKTTVAAATALLAAKKGYKVLVISTDAAHSLGDSFDMELGPEPKEIMPNLFAQEVDVYYSVEKYWGKLTEYLQSLLRWLKVEEILTEEFSILPGMEEVSSFLWVYHHFQDELYDVIIVDSAPTGETLRLLSLPEVARWWIVKVFPIERKVVKVIRPAMKVLTDMPLPEDHTYDAIEELFDKLDIINRTMPKELEHPFFEEWKKTQLGYREEVEELFSPIPTFEAKLFSKEVLGMNSLEEFGLNLFSKKDPIRIFFKGKPYEIIKEGGSYQLLLKLPFVSKEEIKLFQIKDELTIQIENHRRNILLPRFLADLPVKEAKYQDEMLRIIFEKKERKP